MQRVQIMETWNPSHQKYQFGLFGGAKGQEVHPMVRTELAKTPTKQNSAIHEKHSKHLTNRGASYFL